MAFASLNFAICAAVAAAGPLLGAALGGLPPLPCSVGGAGGGEAATGREEKEEEADIVPDASVEWPLELLIRVSSFMVVRRMLSYGRRMVPFYRTFDF